MKKIYSTPKTDVCVIETCILCASGNLGGTGYINPIDKTIGSW
jgi:hypothetical protein